VRCVNTNTEGGISGVYEIRNIIMRSETKQRGWHVVMLGSMLMRVRRIEITYLIGPQRFLAV